MLSFRVSGSSSITTKLKTRLGNVDELEEELLSMLKSGKIRSIINSFHDSNGGVSEMEKKWKEEHDKFL